jgi:hypothetical protein
MRNSIRFIVGVLGLLLATSAFADELTRADYDYMKINMNWSKDDVAKNVPARFRADLHRVINSDINLQDKKKWIATMEASGLCDDLKTQGVLPADMKC